MGFGFGFSVSSEETPPYLNEMVRVQGSGFRVYASWFVVYGLWLTVDGIGLRHSVFSCFGFEFGVKGGARTSKRAAFPWKMWSRLFRGRCTSRGVTRLGLEGNPAYQKICVPEIGRTSPEIGSLML